MHIITCTPSVIIHIHGFVVVELNEMIHLYEGICFGLQAVSCQWLLNVQLHQFRNFYNVEAVGNGFFCCCDRVTSPDTCSNQSPIMISPTCASWCDTFFRVRLLDCEVPDACEISMTTDALDDSNSITNTSYNFRFFFDTFPIETV